MAESKCRACEAPITEGASLCRRHSDLSRREAEAASKYREDMDLLTFLRDGGTQTEYAEQHGITRQAVSARVVRARRRVTLAEHLILLGRWSLLEPEVLPVDS